MGHSILISIIQVVLSDPNRIAQEPDDMAILIGQEKWAFLNNGVTQCLSISKTVYMYEDWRICMNKAATIGRYITLVFRHLSLWTLESSRVRVWLIRTDDLTKPENHRCNQDLGMAENVIKDFQISASSEYPNYPAVNGRISATGWCAALADREPYLQVDFLQETVVEGFQIINWRENVQVMAASTFLFKYSTNDNNYRLKQKYYMDTHLPFDVVQTFLFSTSARATSIRIYPVVTLPNIKRRCLKTELIGCLQPETFSLRCAGKNYSTWYTTKLILIPTSSDPVARTNTNSPTKCIERCSGATSYCTAIIYHSDNNTCYFYLETGELGYQTYIPLKESTELYMRVCDPDHTSDTYALPLFSKTENQVIADAININQPGFILSPGYPFHYTKGFVWLWTVDFGDTDKSAAKKFVNLIFSDISFNIYKNTHSQYQQGFTDEDDRLYIFPENLYELYTNTNTYIFPADFPIVSNISFFNFNFSVKNIPKGIDVLDNSYNNKQASFKTGFSKLQLMLRAYGFQSVQELGRGFKAFVYYSDIPTCMPTTKLSNAYNLDPCDWTSAILLSKSFMGQLWSEEHWKIVDPSFRGYFRLHFDDFDIGCSTGSEFKLQQGVTLLTYCNTNKPSGMIESAVFFIHLRIKRQSNSLVEGFIARYDMKEHDSSLSSLSDGFITDKWVLDGSVEDIEYVCSHQFNKCYLWYYGHSFSWDDAYEKGCQEQNWRLVAIHSRLEHEFINYFLHRTHVSFSNVFIGLRRKTMEEGIIKYEWSDDRPVTFMAWAEEEPSSHPENDCTMMIDDGPYRTYWRSVPCKADQQDVLITICEYDMNQRQLSMILHENPN